jgi:hypothetical protein
VTNGTLFLVLGLCILGFPAILSALAVLQTPRSPEACRAMNRRLGLIPPAQTNSPNEMGE